MGVTQIKGTQVLDGTIDRDDIDITTSTKSLVRKIVAGTNIGLSSTGADAGTGDVTINSTASGSGITRVISSISGVTTGAAVALTDYVYLCTGTFTYTQPTAVSNTNRYTIKNVGSGIITVAFTSAQTGDGTTTLIIRANTSLDLISNNANWKIV